MTINKYPNSELARRYYAWAISDSAVLSQNRISILFCHHHSNIPAPILFSSTFCCLKHSNNITTIILICNMQYWLASSNGRIRVYTKLIQ